MLKTYYNLIANKFFEEKFSKMVLCTIAVIFSTFFAWLASRVKNKHVMILCSIISILIPSIVGGIRQVGVGVDTIGYGEPDAIAAYNSQSFKDFTVSGRGNKELGYQFLCYVTMKTLGHVNWCFFFYQLITIGCFYVGAYKHRKVAPLPLIMLIFISMHWIYSFNMMRQAMAASIIVMGIDHLEKKEYIKFMIYIIVAFFFHASALVCIGFVLGVHVMVASKTYFRHLMVFIILLMIINFRSITGLVFRFVQIWDLVPDRYVGYTLSSSGDWGGGSKTITLSYIGTYILFCLYSRGGKKLLGGLNLEYYKFNTLIVLLNFFLSMGRILEYNLYIHSLTLSFMPFCVKNKYIRLLLIILVIYTVIVPTIRRDDLGGYFFGYKSILD